MKKIYQNYLCREFHLCARCGNIAFCETYPWACPWINGDELGYCRLCLLKVEMEESEQRTGDEVI